MKKRLVSLLLAVVLVLGLIPTALAASYNFDSNATIFTQNFTTETPRPNDLSDYFTVESTPFDTANGKTTWNTAANGTSVAIYNTVGSKKYDDTHGILTFTFKQSCTFWTKFVFSMSGDPNSYVRVTLNETEAAKWTKDNPAKSPYEIKVKAEDKLAFDFYSAKSFDTPCSMTLKNIRCTPLQAQNATVTFDYNYTGAPESATVEVEPGKAIGDKLPADPTREGYRFNGWALSTNLSKKLTAETEIDGDCTYKALWLSNDYKIVFNKNADDATGTMEDQWGTFDTLLTLNKCTFTYEGYECAGWTTVPSSSNVLFKDGDSFTNETDWDGESEYGETVNLYAIWEKAKSDEEKEIDEKLNTAAELISKNYTPKFGTDANLLTMAAARLSDAQKADITIEMKEAASQKDMYNDAAASVDKNGTLHYKWNNTPGSYTSAGELYVRATFVLTYKGVTKEVPDVTVIMGLDEGEAQLALDTQAARLTVPTSIATNTDLKSLPHYLQNTEDSGYGLWAEINWRSSNAGAIKIGSSENLSDHTFPVTVTHAKNDTDVTLTATLTYSGAEKITCSKVFTVKVLGSTKAVDYQALLNKVFDAKGALYDPGTGVEIDKSAVTSDIHFPTTGALSLASYKDYGVGFDGSVTPVILTSSNEDVIASATVANQARLEVYRPLPKEEDKTVTVTVGIYNRVQDATPADYQKQTPLATKDIELTVKALTQQEIDDAAAFMAKVCTADAYWNGIKKANTDKNNITGDLWSFIEIVPDGDSYKFIRNSDDSKWVGVKVDDIDGWYASEKYRAFRSSIPSVIKSENLLVSQPEYNTPVKIDSVLTHAVYGKYYEKFKDTDAARAKQFAKFYKQPVETVVTVIGTTGTVNPNVKPVTVTVNVEGHAFDEKFTDLTGTYTCYDNEYKNAADAVLDVLAKAGYTYTGAPSYITSVTDSKSHTLTAGDPAHGEWSGWMFTVDGQMPKLSETMYATLDTYLLKSEDKVIRFYYVDCPTETGHHTPKDGSETIIKAATHEETGTKSYTCSMCGETITETIPATGHTWGAPTYHWSADYASCTALRTCTAEDEGVETETAIAAYTVVTPATATTAGTGRYTATFENEAFTTQTHDVTIPATGGSSSGGSTGGTSRPSGSKKDSAAAETPKTRFDDVKASNWYQEAVDYVAENGIMDGTAARTFSPNAPATRAMLVTVLHRLAGTPDAEKAHGFTDLANGAWYADAVAWAAENGIVSGVGNALFAPNAYITREQLAAILYRYAIRCGLDVTAAADLNAYTDGAQVSAWAQDAMRWAIASGLISGRSASALAPHSGATRAEIAQILMNFAKLLKK